ncbi:hypothetical protein D3C78_1198030 [compost metagenome]
MGSAPAASSALTEKKAMALRASWRMLSLSIAATRLLGFGSMASNKGEDSRFPLDGSALYWSSNSTISASPWKAARPKGVIPSRSSAWMLALPSNNARTTSRFPALIAP